MRNEARKEKLINGGRNALHDGFYRMAALLSDRALREGRFYQPPFMTSWAYRLYSDWSFYEE